MKTNIKKISEITGFSPATISNALNRKKGVNGETAAKIFHVAKELGYISETSITKIRLVIYKKNGQILDGTPFFSLMIDGIEKECRENNYEMTITYLDSQAEGYRESMQQVISDPGTAIVLLGTELDKESFEPFKMAKCPLLTLDYWNPDMSCNGVFINNRDSARAAVDYLINMGHREIGYLRGSFRIKAFCSRAAGYKTTMISRGLEVKNEYVVTLGTTIDKAYHDMLKYLETEPNLPTAFFADDDMIALGAMKALQECGYKVPDEISIIGFDDLPYSEISTPRLTSLRVPKQEMGRLAVHRIIEMINRKDNMILKTQICTEFVERDSVKKIK